MVTRPARLAASLVVAIVAFVAGWMALLPGVAYWDTGELQAVGPLMGTAHPTGFPTYVLLGWLASVILQPLGEPAFRMNVLSAVCVAVAAGVTVDLVRALTGWLVLGMAAGIALALTPITWAIATHAEAHSLHLALVAILLWLLVAWDARARAAAERAMSDDEDPWGFGGMDDRGVESPDRDRPGTDDRDTAGLDIDRTVSRDRGDRYLVAAAVVFGLAVGNHSLTLLLAIPVALYVHAVDPAIWHRRRLVLWCVGAFVLTVALVYLELPLRAGPFRAALVYGTPNTWDGFRYIVLAEQFQGSLNDPLGDLPRKFGELVARTSAQFGILAPLVPIGFIATALRLPRYALLTGSAVAITCFFAASYVNADINRYYLGPALMAWTWLAILAAAAVEVVTGVAGDAFPTPAEATSPPTPHRPRGRTAAGFLILAIGVALLVPTLLEAPGRYATVDQRAQLDAARWTRHTLDVVEPDSVIVSWWSFSTPLWYAQRVQGQRPDVTIIDDRTRLDENLGGLTDVIDANLGKRPVYVIRLDRDEVALLAERYDLDYIDGRDASALTRVVGLKSAPA